MADQLERFILTGVVIGETTSRNRPATKGWAISSLKSAFKLNRGGCMAIAVFDENGKLSGVDVVGSPSEAMRQMMDEEFREDQQGTVTA